MSLTVQLDMFNATVPIHTFDWGNETNCKIFEYNDELQFDDPCLEKHYVINVPCYKLESLVGIVADDESKTFKALAYDKSLHDCVVRVYENNGTRSWNSKFYVLANAKTKKFVEQHFLFAKLKGNISKMPRITKKVVKVESIYYRDEDDVNFIMAKVCWAADHLLSLVEQ